MYVHIPFTEMPRKRVELDGIRSVISNLLAQQKYFFSKKQEVNWKSW